MYDGLNYVSYSDLFNLYQATYRQEYLMEQTTIASSVMNISQALDEKRIQKKRS